MDKEIVEGNLGTVGKYDVEFKGGCLVVELNAGAGPVSGGVVIKVDAGKVLDAIAAAIPGQIDDAVIAMIKGALVPATA
jgi:hypothetical protein